MLPTVSYYIQPIAVAVIFQIYVRRRATAWWLKYNYLTSVALGASAGIWAVMWFFALNYVDHTPTWWGNCQSPLLSNSLRSESLPSPVLTYRSAPCQPTDVSYGGPDYDGCEGIGGCPRLPLPDVGYFGPGVGEFSF